MSKLVLWYRIFVKLFLFFVFGLGSIILITAVFPTIRLLSKSNSSFKRKSRKAMCNTQKFFVGLGILMRGFELKVKDKEYLSHLSGKIVVANHPSLLDVVMLLSIIPNADCIIKASLGQAKILLWVWYTNDSVSTGNFICFRRLWRDGKQWSTYQLGIIGGRDLEDSRSQLMDILSKIMVK